MNRVSSSVAALFVAACASSSPAPQRPASYPQPYPPPYPQQQGPYAQPPYPQPAPYPQQPSPYPSPQPQYTPPAPVAPGPTPAPAPAPARPLLPPLVGTVAWQVEVRGVIGEDIAALAADNQARVRGIPLVFDPTLDINAYASCDNQGSPRITGTEGLLEAIDAIAQTRATDELYGTRTYDAYINAVMPQLANVENASPALPPTIIPMQYVADPRRWSRAHEWFDEIVAFTFGHELSHHYLGHTGCANGQPAPFGGLAQLAGALGHGFAQPLEIDADIHGTMNMLDAGRARATQGAYRWNEEGALALLDFFQRLEQATLGAKQIFVAFILDHPAAAIRIPIVQATARTWTLQHPG